MLTPLLALAAVLGAAEATPSAQRPEFSSNVQVIEARLVPGTFKGVLIRLPQLRVYDSKGRLLVSETGYGPELGPAVAEIFAGRGTPDEARPLSMDLKVLLQDGRPLEQVPGADFTAVEYWSTWCVPCHALARDLAELFARHPKLRFNLVHVVVIDGAARDGP